jgi:hypothetical protein
MRCYKRLAPTIAAFVAFVGEWVETVNVACASEVLVVDGSLFKARGPGWHQLCTSLSYLSSPVLPPQP